MGISPSI